MYKSKHFKVYELVDPDTFKIYGEGAWRFFSPEALQMIDGVWEYCNSIIIPGKTVIIINDWKWGGLYKWSGFRTIFCKEGSDRSFHRQASGFDLKIKGIRTLAEYDFLRDEIVKNKDHPCLKGIMGMEIGTPTWLHIDDRNVDDRIKLVKG